MSERRPVDEPRLSDIEDRGFATPNTTLDLCAALRAAWAERDALRRNYGALCDEHDIDPEDR